MLLGAPSQSGGLDDHHPFTVMIVDDAVVVRGLLSRWLNEHPQFEVVATAANGRIALDVLQTASPEIVLLDLDMPEMDGLSALPHILARRPQTAVIVASTLTRRNAELALKCVSLGAVECISKPDGNRALTTSDDFRNELIGKMAALAGARRRRAGMAQRPAPGLPLPALPERRTADPRFSATLAETPPRVPVRQRPLVTPRALVIGASTGGPRAVADVLGAVGGAIQRVPTIVVQHMPAVFTAVFADHLRGHTGRPAREPFDGEPLMAGTIYVAPGGRHLRLTRGEDASVIARITDTAPVNFCRPSVDLMFADAAAVYGASALAVILTGMGADGLAGARALVASGASVIAQDEATSAVWGMPGAVAKAGLAREVLPLDRIGAVVAHDLAGPDGGRAG